MLGTTSARLGRLAEVELQAVRVSEAHFQANKCGSLIMLGPATEPQCDLLYSWSLLCQAVSNDLRAW